MKILLTGGTGFIGKTLISQLTKKNTEVLVLTRRVKWAQKRLKQCQCIDSLDKIPADTIIDGIINLAGAPIDKRWSKRYKRILKDSRHNTTRACIDLIQRLEHKPKWFISGSAIGFYGAHGDESLSEDAKPNSGFTHELCQQWEDIALEANAYHVRVCLLRTGVVLGKNGGALKRMLTPFKFCLGGRIASGKQWFSWIHMQDMIRVILFLMQHDDCDGAYNATSPNPVQNKIFTKTLGRVLRRPTIFPMPGFVVSLLFGEMGRELLVKGQRVVPTKLEAHGFQFSYPELQAALVDIIKRK